MESIGAESWSNVPNSLLDFLIKKKNRFPEKIRVLVCVIRQSYGYQKTYCCHVKDGMVVPMGPTEIARLLSLPRQNVDRTLKYWEEHGVIRRYRMADEIRIQLIADPSSLPMLESEYPQKTMEGETDYNMAPDFDDTLIRKKRKLKENKASGRKVESGFKSVPGRDSGTGNSDDPLVLEIQNFLTATFISQFGLPASSELARRVRAQLQDASIDQFKIAVQARAPAFRSYELATYIATDCAATHNFWPGAMRSTVDSAEEYEREYYERQRTSSP